MNVNTPRQQTPRTVTVIGGGLAGSEAALRLADMSVQVRLVEMRPLLSGPAHHTDGLAELVCSNSFKGTDPDSATGRLKLELATLRSPLLAVAHETSVPAGAALAVDRELFSARVTQLVTEHPLIDLVRTESRSIPRDLPAIIATGPLTSSAMESSLSEIIGEKRLAFYDAAAPIVAAESIENEIAFPASRYGKGASADYLNCPMDQPTYEHFRDELLSAQRVTAKDFETKELFSACQPIEEVARTGVDAMRFGPLKPVGLADPRTGERPYAVVQLRADNTHRSSYNLVGFQTNLTFAEQRRVLRLIPGLERAEILRYGVMHRNTFIDAPRVLSATLALEGAPGLFIAGQLSGTEGYLEAIATGTLTALNAFAFIHDAEPWVLPADTALGALIAYATNPATTTYQPMHVNWGLVPALEQRVKGKRARYCAYGQRAGRSLESYLSTNPIPTRKSDRG